LLQVKESPGVFAMSAQEELRELFQEIDRSTDRALDGLSRVRASTKMVNLQPSRLFLGCQLGLIASLLYTIGHIVTRGG
jgi:hypothetical protein